jgi:maltodextrin utilization protein YvdJ
MIGCLSTSVFLFLIASFIVSLGLIVVFGLAMMVVITMHSVLLYSINGNKRLLGIH